MAKNLALNDKLIQEAQKLGHHKSKKDAVNEALAEYVKRRKQLNDFLHSVLKEMFLKIRNLLMKILSPQTLSLFGTKKSGRKV